MRSAASGLASVRAASAITTRCARRHDDAAGAKRAERRDEAIGESFALGDEARGAGIDHRHCVARLVIVDRLRKRHEHGRQACGAQFGPIVVAPARQTTRSAQA